MASVPKAEVAPRVEPRLHPDDYVESSGILLPQSQTSFSTTGLYEEGNDFWERERVIAGRVNTGRKKPSSAPGGLCL